VLHLPVSALEHCVTYRRADGRDGLACFYTNGVWQELLATSVFTVDLAAPAAQQKTQLAYLFSDAFEVLCNGVDPTGAQAYGPWADGVAEVDIDRLEVADQNGDGTPDLRVHLRRAYVGATPALHREVAAQCKSGASGIPTSDVGMWVPAGALLPKATSVVLEFAGDGASFHATPAAQALLERWQREAPASAGAPRSW
jgi:hypothetical protein